MRLEIDLQRDFVTTTACYCDQNGVRKMCQVVEEGAGYMR